jgi:heme A synthase
MGIRRTAARRINSSGISTIVFTSVLICIVMYLSGLLSRRGNASASPTGIRGHLGTFAAYVRSALLAGGLVSHYLGMLVWVLMAEVLLALGSSHCTYTPKRSAE